MIKEVIIISKTHLDIGFTDLAENVKKCYMSIFLDQALKLSEYYRKSDSEKNYIWTIGSWLVYELLNELPREECSKLENAIIRGDIAWHAMPFTMHCELNNEFFFRRSLDISKMLDKRFNRKTIAAKFTDVPGHTRGIVGPMADNGIKLLHIGINPGSAFVELPTAFKWLDSRGKSIIVIYQKDYGEKYLLPDQETLVCIDVTGDNLGPVTIQKMEELYNNLEKQYPAAKVRCGTLNEVAECLMQYEASLPVVSDEIGDTWIHGVGTDPLKVARFKELCHWRESFGLNKKFDKFDFELLQISEHTWGMDEKVYLDDYKHYLGCQLQQLQESEKGEVFASSWVEQRHILDTAVNFLDAPLKRKALEQLKSCDAIQPDISGFENLIGLDFETEFFTGNFSEDGSISSLVKKDNDKVYADYAHHIFSLSGVIFGKEDYDRFFKQYNRLDEQWVIDDFTKQGIPESIKHSLIKPKLTNVYRQEDKYEVSFIIVLAMESSDKTGMPDKIFFNYKFSKTESSIKFTLTWFCKFSARIAHAIHLECNPLLADSTWKISKLGEPIDIMHIASKGARSLHAVDEKIICQNNTDKLLFYSSHAPLVAMGKSKLLNFDNKLPDMGKGIHYNLYNNIWGTNFPMWYDDNARFDFKLSF